MFNNVSWAKAALFGGVIIIGLLFFHPPTAERIIAAVMELANILSNIGG